MNGLLMTIARSPAAQADDLDAVTARVTAATGFNLVRRSHVVAVLEHPLIAGRLTVYCSPAGSHVSGHCPGLYPDRAFFDFVARAGSAVTGDPAWVLEPTLTKCHAQALRTLTANEPNAHADGFGVGRSEMECDVHGHSGGGSSLTISKRQ
ncbi:hypothetical protein [Lichenibacterium ramalinae]|uniref:Uncharacterized protein n=1 Tax=Lichenibacterium ramalinae TaxID=2316527 RepID=A0A4Q2R6S9_9HYPH|nr:hypothetical protein [Lichenibacterium ramalinae]RYB01379.1 hypothetical protein D3272_26460 [Lichenibacterium ramalinae]